MTELENLWSFNYHRGPAFKTAIVRARGEVMALAVASAWCLKNGLRAPSGVLPMVVADESILMSEPLRAEAAAVVQEKVAATVKRV